MIRKKKTALAPREDKGSSTVSRLKQPPVESWFSTGCTILDLAIADTLPGGFPGGRITHIFGDPSTTKSVLALEPLGAAQRRGGKAYLLDVECSLDFGWAEVNGVRVFRRNKEGDLLLDKEGIPLIREDFKIENPDTIEEAFDKIIPAILKEVKEKGLEHKCVIAIDSLTALNAGVDLEMDLEEKTYGGDRAKQFGRAYRKVLRSIFNNGVAVVLTDQLRDDMKTGGKRYSGGRAISFYSDVQILLDLTGEKIKNDREVVIGIEVGFLIKKNKVAPPFREGKFRFLFAEGIDDIGTSLQWLKENKTIPKEQLQEMKQAWIDKYSRLPEYTTPKKIQRKVEEEMKKEIKSLGSRGWYTFCGIKKQKLSEMVSFIGRKDLEPRLRREVFKVWKEIYTPEPVQKEKVRF